MMAEEKDRPDMTPAMFIRTEVFGFHSQEEFAEALGYTQASISRFESGEAFSSAAQKKIRDLAAARGVAWDNNWFFEAPRKSS